MVGRTKLKRAAVAVVICVLAVYAEIFADEPGGEDLFMSVDIYDHYAMNASDTGYFEFNPNGAGSANPSVCEGRMTGLVEDDLDGDGLPDLRDHFPCVYNANINNWFRENPGHPDEKKKVIKFSRKLAFAKLNDFKYKLEDSKFFPLDDVEGTLVDQGIESEQASQDGDLHNIGFTMHLHSEFTYRAKDAAKIKIHFTGGDDLWAFIDGKLVYDFGGIHQGGSLGSISLKQMIKNGLFDLQEENSYQVDIFFAKRDTHNSNFNLHLPTQFLQQSKKKLSYFIVK